VPKQGGHLIFSVVNANTGREKDRNTGASGWGTFSFYRARMLFNNQFTKRESHPARIMVVKFSEQINT